MQTFKVKIERTYTTYVEVVAENKSEVLSKLYDMGDAIYEQELEQMNVDENVTIL